MRTVRRYDRNEKTVTRISAWEEQREDGSIEHHVATTSETYRGKRYLRVFTEAFRAATRALDKNAEDTLVYIAATISRDTNVASVTYGDLESYLGVSNQAVNRIMQLLQRLDYIRMYKRGQWMLNPTIAAGCYEHSYERLVIAYFELPGYEAKQNAKKKRQETEGVDEQDADRQNV